MVNDVSARRSCANAFRRRSMTAIAAISLFGVSGLGVLATPGIAAGEDVVEDGTPSPAASQSATPEAVTASTDESAAPAADEEPAAGDSVLPSPPSDSPSPVADKAADSDPGADKAAGESASSESGDDNDGANEAAATESSDEATADTASDEEATDDASDAPKVRSRRSLRAATGGSTFSCGDGSVYLLRRRTVPAPIANGSNNGFIDYLDPYSGNPLVRRHPNIDQIPWKFGSGQHYQALGIGPGGQTAYAIQFRQGAPFGAIWKFENGAWTSRKIDLPRFGDPNLGAVNLATGEYWYGVIEPLDINVLEQDKKIHIYRYNENVTPARSEYMGYFYAYGAGGGSASNGDMAFDGLGNMYIVRGNNRRLAMHQVPDDVLKTAASVSEQYRGKLYSPRVRPVTIRSSGRDVDGLAFLPDGTLVVADDKTESWFDVRGVRNGKIGEQEFNRTIVDAASCSVPMTLTIQKKVTRRVGPEDQFDLSIDELTDPTEKPGKDGLSGHVVTNGANDGLQDRKLTFPVPPGGYTFRETMVENSAGALADYDSSYTCVDEAGTVLASGEGTEGSVTLTGRQKGQNIVCTFTNTPTISLSVTKKILDQDNQTVTDASGWDLTAVSTQEATYLRDEDKETKTTPANGQVDWNFVIPSGESTDITIREAPTTGTAAADFQKMVCYIERPNAKPRTRTFNDLNEAIPEVPNGSTISCVLENKLTNKGDINIQKVDGGYPTGDTSTPTPSTGNVNHTGLAGAHFELWRDSDGNGKLDANTDEKLTFDADPQNKEILVTPENGQVSWTDLPLGKYCFAETYTPTGYDRVLPKCFELTADSASGTFTIPNYRSYGEVTWTKVNAEGEQLNGSEWAVTRTQADDPEPAGDTQPADTAATEDPVNVTDCVADSETACTGPDKDPAKGAFKVTGLKWGSYQLAETKAPAGYALNEDIAAFVIGKDNLKGEIGPITNKKATGPTLPITGGPSAYAYLLGGGLLIILSAGAAAGALRKRVA